MGSRPVPKIGLSFEYLMWVFTRISGVALFLLAFIGIAGAFVMGARTQTDVGALMRWTFFPNTYHVQNSNIPDIDGGYAGPLGVLSWANVFWQIIQMLILFFGVTHGINGLRVVIEDYVSASWVQIFLRGLLFLSWLFILLVAIYVIWFV